MMHYFDAHFVPPTFPDRWRMSGCEFNLIGLAMGNNPFFTWMNICFEWIILDFIWMNKIFEWIILDFFWTNKFFEWIICVLFWMNKFFEWIILLCDWMNYWMNNKKCIIHKKINSQSLEDKKVGYILQKYSFEKYS